MYDLSNLVMMGMEEVKKSDIGREQGSSGGWTVFLHLLLINPMLLAWIGNYDYEKDSE